MNKKSDMPFDSDTNFIYCKGSRLDYIKNVILRPWSAPCHGFEPFVVQTLCIMSVCGCTYEADPEWRGGFELKPTSFQNLL